MWHVYFFSAYIFPLLFSSFKQIAGAGLLSSQQNCVARQRAGTASFPRAEARRVGVKRGLERREGKGPAATRPGVQPSGSPLRKWQSPREKWLNRAAQADRREALFPKLPGKQQCASQPNSVEGTVVSTGLLWGPVARRYPHQAIP